MQAPPARKLPAFYVLDSIAKNVGTPYTVYFGLNLFHTYMNTFASVDNNVRRKLDEMRKTWSQPVPGSQLTYPVFQRTVTSKIDEAMDSWAKKQYPARTPQIPNRPPMPSLPNRQYLTPPARPLPIQAGSHQSFPSLSQPLPHINGATHAMDNNNLASMSAQQARQMPLHYTQQSTALPTPYLPSQDYHYEQSPYSATVPPPNPASAVVDLEALKGDIDDLIVDAKIASYSNPMDPASQQKLASLQGLKEIVESGTLSQQDMMDVRRSISEQLTARSNNRSERRSVPTPPPMPAYVQQQQQQQPQSLLQAGLPPSVSSGFLNSANLSELLRVTAPQNHPTPPPPPPPAASTGQVSTPLQNVPDLSSGGDTKLGPPAENPLIAQLRASGLLTSNQSPPPAATPYPAAASTPASSINPSTNTYSRLPYFPVSFTSASLRTSRPELLRHLFEARPNKCNSCGRRFTADEHGRERKARHLDWHFQTRTRMVEAERRGIQRSWYVDEREWIRSRECDDANNEEDENKGQSEEGGDRIARLDWNTAAGDAVADPSKSATIRGRQLTESYVRVPNDAKLRSEPCPICQEKFEKMWSEELQDFIWRDAVQVAGPTLRIYHASCFAEATRDRENTATTPVPTSVTTGAAVSVNNGGSGSIGNDGRGETVTPDSVLGKRKAVEESYLWNDGVGDASLDDIKSVKIKLEQP